MQITAITADEIRSTKWIRVTCGEGRVKKSFEPVLISRRVKRKSGTHVGVHSMHSKIRRHVVWVDCLG